MLRAFGLCFFVLCEYFSLQTVYAQARKELTIEQDAVNNAVSVYYQSLGEQSGIYRGVEYTGYPFVIKTGHQYFENTDPDLGSVFYDGMLYKNIPMWYDLVKNQLIVQYLNHYSNVVLHSELIDHFSILNHHFIHIRKDSSVVFPLSPGFYDRVYQGKTVILVKRSKSTMKDVRSEGIFLAVSEQKNVYYLNTGGKYIQVESQGSVLKVLGNKQKEIQEFMKKNNVKFRKDPENAIVRMVTYYDQLTASK